MAVPDLVLDGATEATRAVPRAKQARQADQETPPRDEALFGGHHKAPLRGHASKGLGKTKRRYRLRHHGSHPPVIDRAT
jgi:hypothetical protein